MKRILLVDDQLDIREILTDLLGNYGFYVEACTNGVAAFEKLQEEQFDLVLTDLMMTGGDGFSLIKKIQGKIDVAVLVMTGGGNYVSHLDKIRALEQEGYQILKKPFEKDTLLDAVRLKLRGE